VHWAGGLAPYRIRTADFFAEHVNLLQQGFAVWDVVRGSSFTPRFDGDTTIDRATSDDSQAVMRVSNPGNADDNAMMGGGTLAVTRFAWFINSGELADSDITFNHRVDFNPDLPASAPEPTPTRFAGSDEGGGCGTVGGGPPPPQGPDDHAGRLLLVGGLALALWATRRRPIRTQT
jgi:hypothetical protein